MQFWKVINLHDDKERHTYLKQYETNERASSFTKRITKDIEHMNQAKSIRVYQIVKPYLHIKNWFKKYFCGPTLAKELENQTKQKLKLEYEVSQLKRQLTDYHALIDKKQKSNGNMTREWVQYFKKYHVRLDLIDVLSKEKMEHSQIKGIADELFRTYSAISDPKAKDLFVSLTAELYEPIRYPEFLIRMVEEKNFTMPFIDSFSQSLYYRFRLHQEGAILPEYVLDDKAVGYRFAAHFDIKCPVVSKEVYAHDHIPFKSSYAIKPRYSDGGRGVYLVIKNNHIVDVKHERILTSYEQLKYELNKDITTGSVEKDEWYMEPLFLNTNDTLPTDLKFYCFYGEVGVVLEVERAPETKYCWWDSDGNRIQVGKYEHVDFEGTGFTKEALDLVKKISCAIPAPFIRIDILRTDKGLMFGEFTKRPGNFDQFNDETDRLLGKLFMEAESRLRNDCDKNKEFKFYSMITDENRS